jgi:hypothetical protein
MDPKYPFGQPTGTPPQYRCEPAYGDENDTGLIKSPGLAAMTAEAADIIATSAVTRIIRLTPSDVPCAEVAGNRSARRDAAREVAVSAQPTGSADSFNKFGTADAKG